MCLAFENTSARSEVQFLCNPACAKAWVQSPALPICDREKNHVIWFFIVESCLMSRMALNKRSQIHTLCRLDRNTATTERVKTWNSHCKSMRQRGSSRDEQKKSMVTPPASWKRCHMIQGANHSGQVSVIDSGSGRRSCEGVNLGPFWKLTNPKNPEMQWISWMIRCVSAEKLKN